MDSRDGMQELVSMAAVKLSLEGGVAVVTGAASGIGAALAHALADRGCALALTDRNAEGLAMMASSARARGVKVSEHAFDVADADAVAALPAAVLAEHGRVSVLINNAGVALVGRFEQVSAADFEWLFGINFWGTVRMTRAFLPVLQRQAAAQIVNMSSVYGLMAPPGETAYAASKFAVRGFSEALANELESSSVGVTVVHPGGIRTAVARSARVAESLDPAEVAAGVAAFEKLLRTTPEVAASVIVRGIERRQRRVLIGNDAKQIARLVRLFPVTHWRLVQRTVARKLRRGADSTAQTS